MCIARLDRAYSSPRTRRAWLSNFGNARCILSWSVPFRSSTKARLDIGYRLDLVVAGQVIVDLKCVASLAPIHTAQLLTYLRLTKCRDRPSHQLQCPGADAGSQAGAECGGVAGGGNGSGEHRRRNGGTEKAQILDDGEGGDSANHPHSASGSRQFLRGQRALPHFMLTDPPFCLLRCPPSDFVS